MKLISSFIFLYFVYHLPSFAQQITFKDELKTLYDISTLPQFTNSLEEQRSTYDTTGGNNDGFSGTYSFVRRNADSSLVMLDIKGPGTINRIWTPTPTTDTLDFYLDDTLHPAFSICYIDLFSGKVTPFVRPVCNHAAGGYFCYLPISFQQRCMIVCRGQFLQFYQVQYRLYPQTTKIEKFHTAFNVQEKELLQKINAEWDHSGSMPEQTITPQKSVMPYAIKARKKTSVFNEKKGGRIVGIELNSDVALDSNLYIRVTWDHEAAPAIYCPATDFFGYAFGKPSMQSLLLGYKDGKHYCYFPMPFDKDASIELINRSATGVAGHVTVYYTHEKRKMNKEGKFYAHWVKNNLDKEPFHVFLDIRSRGHYVGTILQAQGFEPGTGFFEGDDSCATDGIFRIHGTGSEDYFNGGWYNLKGRWDTTRSLPLSGCLTYSAPLSRTGGYRFYLSDKIPFTKSIYMGIEHGGTKPGWPVSYTSLAFYYADFSKE